MATSARVGRRREIVRSASFPHGKPFQAGTALSTLIVVLTLESLAQTGEPTVDPSAAAADHVIAQDANSCTVEWVERLTNAVSGHVSQRSHIYVEVGTGLNYQDESGRWRPSQDLIELTDDGGAAALHGPHKARFSANLTTPGAITLTTASNRLVRSHPLGLYYFAAHTGQSTLIGLVKDSVAELHPPNQLVYRDCLEV